MQQFWKTLLFLGFTMASFQAAGQSYEIPESKWAITPKVSHQDLLVEFSLGQLGVVHNVAVRPQYGLEVQHFLSKRDHSTTFFSAQGSFYNNLYHDRWYTVMLGMGVENRYFDRLLVALQTRSGVGLITSSDIQYTFNGEVWEPTRGDGMGYLALFWAPRLDVGYRLKTGPRPVDILLQGDISANINDRIFVLPYYSVGVGVRVGL
ncbi:MAG TPA: hypothetical protein DCE41_25560 [Cytophagales bacterium]|nr:hypothetical protein [Cytophagales bacterium]HAA19907.1 hypothetical protein [Cytophagales bacterium]HAP62665.1 hypothetical protein [Cytophagales bacterium]